MLSLRHALRRLRRGLHGDLRVLLFALAVAVGAVAAVGLFTERVRLALAYQSGEALGADRVFSSREPLPKAFIETLRAQSQKAVPVVSFPSVVFRGEQSSLASLKAVRDGYPARGAVWIASAPFEAAAIAAGIPAPGEAWVDARVWSELGLKGGEVIQVGSRALKVTAVVDREPDRGGSFMDLAPRVLMHADDLAQSGLLTTGSRAQHQWLLAATPEQLRVLDGLAVPDDVKRLTPQDARPEVRNALTRAGDFLDVAVLATLLIAAAAVALAARQHGVALRDEVALLKCLGARQAFILRALLWQLLCVSLLGAVMGLALGVVIQALIAHALAPVMGAALPMGSMWPLLQAALLGAVMLFGFAGPPLLQARRASPMRVLQRDLSAPTRDVAVGAVAALTVLALLAWQTGEWRLALATGAGALCALGLLSLGAFLLMRAVQPLRKRGGMAWRFGLGNLARRGSLTVAQAVALGLGLMALLLVSVVRDDLLDSWQARVPENAPNQFLINIQPEQRDALQKFFAARGIREVALMPMARARLTAINDRAVTVDSFDDPETRRWINRDFNLSWTDRFGDDNRMVEGPVWDESHRGQPWLSVDDYVIRRLNVKLGDRLTLDFAGAPITLTLYNVREVQWDSFRPNFFLVTPPGVLDTVPHQWLGSFYLPGDAAHRSLLRDLVVQFPNITPLDVGALLAQVKGIMDRIVEAVEWLFLFTLLAGVAVLLTAIESTRAERRREIALLRTLGASRARVWQGVLAEYAVLGAMAGLVAAVAAQLLAWVLATQVFQLPYGPRPLIWISGAVLGAVAVSTLAAVTLRGVLKTPPRVVLQAG